MEENKKENANIKDNENIISKTTVDNVENITDNISKDGQVKKQKIIPSYEKKNVKFSKNSKKNDNKKNFKIKSRFSKIIIFVIIISILAIIGLFIYNIYLNNKYKKYEIYNEKMSIYGFNLMYDNKSLIAKEKITKSEAIKMVISTAYNLYDISNFAPIENPTYDNEIWVKYAKEVGIVTEDINKENQNERITYIDVLMMLSKVKVDLLGMDLDIEGKPNFEDFDDYTNDEQTVLKDMVWNKIIENNTTKLNGKRKIVKGELNELLINFAEKYRTISLNRLDKFVINEEKLPYNYEEYPYVLANVNKKIYETKFYVEDAKESKTPIELYAEEKQNFQAIDGIINKYFTTILNIDYEKISLEEFKDNINFVSMYSYSDEQIKDYIDYVKANKIKLSGNVNLQLPIIYYDGKNIRARVIIEYNIESSDTLENLIFSDRLTGNTYKYNTKGELMCLDVPFARDENTKNLYISMGSINKNIAGNIRK